MQEGTDNPAEPKAPISLYEFYILGITHLIAKAPWELQRAVSEYHGNFLTEQRCIGLSILLLLGEEHVSPHKLQDMPKFQDQVRASVNQATFTRALKHYFSQHGIESKRAEMVLERMHSYLTDSRQADKEGHDPLLAMAEILARRVPPKTERQREQYTERVEKIYEYIASLVQDKLLQRYQIID